MELDSVTAASFVYPAMRKGEGREERASAHVPMYHIYQRCLSRILTLRRLLCHPQMSGTGPMAKKGKKAKRNAKRPAGGGALGGSYKHQGGSSAAAQATGASGGSNVEDVPCAKV